MFIPTPEERIHYCRVCTNYKSAGRRQEFCGLTDMPPVFEKRCPEFDLNLLSSKKDFERYASFETTGEATSSSRSRITGIFILILGLFKFCVSVFLMALSSGHGGLGILPILLGFAGIIMIIAGLAKIKQA